MYCCATSHIPPCTEWHTYQWGGIIYNTDWFKISFSEFTLSVLPLRWRVNSMNYRQWINKYCMYSQWSFFEVYFANSLHLKIVLNGLFLLFNPFYVLFLIAPTSNAVVVSTVTKKACHVRQTTLFNPTE